jgi:hypothetical protein
MNLLFFRQGHTQIVVSLLQYGADPSLRCNFAMVSYLGFRFYYTHPRLAINFLKTTQMAIFQGRYRRRYVFTQNVPIMYQYLYIVNIFCFLNFF